ncbi:hypothetical protein D3C81_1938860 [compost metagenome]
MGRVGELPAPVPGEWLYERPAELGGHRFFENGAGFSRPDYTGAAAQRAAGYLVPADHPNGDVFAPFFLMGGAGRHPVPVSGQ